MAFNSNVISIGPFVESVRSTPSPEPSVLPLRTKGTYPPWVTNVPRRKQNAKLYSSLKSKLMRTELLAPAESGLYFFFKMEKEKAAFYYIGIADSIKRRLGEHLTRLDYIFYSIAFPHQAETYFKEVMEFYGEGLYPDHKEEYERQFQCYKSMSFESIAWLSNHELDYSDWDELETFYISMHQPCVNIDKKDATPNERFRPLFLKSRNHVCEKIVGTQLQNGCA